MSKAKTPAWQTEPLLCSLTKLPVTVFSGRVVTMIIVTFFVAVVDSS